ncbi:DNase I-like protein [Auriscalpium vulgare]|uniref:DNase I-like protein n=1 Tax=Auriscalpium vulgare TaxID=40419 RepID=A0ACB8R3R1_9AGAM|nr:DNase I-like protein [Auriscalpium vulgare]
MHGRKSPSINHNDLNKWPEMANLIRSSRSAILGVQETHLTDPHVDSLRDMYRNSFVIHNSADPDRPSRSAGVAFVINKAMVNTGAIATHVIIPGRALALEIKWREGQSLTILNVYAPNDPGEHPAFWQTIADEWRRIGLGKPDFVLGDHNIVEDALDRAPVRMDDERAVEALRELREIFDVQDTWRNTHPNTKLYTHRQPNLRMEYMHARLDQIYVARSKAKYAFEWGITHTGLSDHALISVRYAPEDAPEIGPGRWTLPLYLLNDPEVIRPVISLGMTLQDKVNATHEEDDGADREIQMLWAEFKTKIIQIARARSKLSKGKMASERKRRDTKKKSSTSKRSRTKKPEM